MQILGKAVKQARLERGLTQSDVAERIDVDVRTVLKIEKQKGIQFQKQLRDVQGYEDRKQRASSLNL